MEFTEEILQKAADDGSEKVAQAFSKLSATRVEVSVSRVETIPLGKCLERLSPPQGESVAVYAQLLFGAPGVAILTMSREDALSLVDLLNQQPVGTTGILKDIDRSAIKETLNILSNSYITSLADRAGLELRIDVPYMITASRLQDIISMFLQRGDAGREKAIVFETTLIVTQYRAKANLNILFSENLADILKNAK